jgi:hypothetical protein
MPECASAREEYKAYLSVEPSRTDRTLWDRRLPAGLIAAGVDVRHPRGARSLPPAQWRTPLPPDGLHAPGPGWAGWTPAALGCRFRRTEKPVSQGIRGRLPSGMARAIWCKPCLLRAIANPDSTLHQNGYSGGHPYILHCTAVTK